MGAAELFNLLRQRSIQRSVLALVLLCFGAKWAIASIVVRLHSRKLRGLRVLYQRQCQRAFEQLEAQLTEDGASLEESEEITGLCTSELVRALQTGRLRPTQVLRAYQCKALEANRQTNAIAEPILEAMAQAEALEGSAAKGPLYGVPISLKEEIPLKGHIATQGLSNLLEEGPGSEDPVLIQVLKNLGAVPFVRTNVAQMTMSLESGNPIYGYTCNPHDMMRTSGGSSGGEGALIAGGGSIMGVAGDVGGSIRVPAAFCGIVGFKPTPYRTNSYKGCDSNYEWGQQNEYVTHGSMARDVDGAVLLYRSLIDPEMHRLDPRVSPIPFNERIYLDTCRLRIGFCVEDGYLPWVTPPCRRAVLEAKAALEAQGHELVAWAPRGREEAFGFHCTSMVADGGAMMLDFLYGDDCDPSLDYFVESVAKPSLWRSFKVFFVSLLDGQRGHRLRERTGLRSVTEYWNLTGQLEAYRLEVIDSWQAAGLDALINPVMPVVAPHKGATRHLLEAGAAMVMFNILGFPAGSVPVTRVNAEDVAEMKNFQLDNLHGRADFARKTMEGAVGLPVGVQCVGMRYHEEVCLRVMKELETALQTPGQK